MVLTSSFRVKHLNWTLEYYIKEIILCTIKKIYGVGMDNTFAFTHTHTHADYDRHAMQVHQHWSMLNERIGVSTNAWCLTVFEKTHTWNMPHTCIESYEGGDMKPSCASGNVRTYSLYHTTTIPHHPCFVDSWEIVPIYTDRRIRATLKWWWRQIWYTRPDLHNTWPTGRESLISVRHVPLRVLKRQSNSKNTL